MSSIPHFTHLAIPGVSANSRFPALSLGLVLFTFLLLILNFSTNGWANHKFSLYAYAPFHFELNRLSFYPLFHQNLLHWLFNSIALFQPLSVFESKHGTVYTGVTLNILTVVAGLQFCVISTILFSGTQVIGLSGIVFSFCAYYAYKEHHHKPVLYTFRTSSSEINIQTLHLPFILLAVTFVVIPGSSFVGHLSGISAGFLLALGKLNFMYPPTSAISFVERKLEVVISKIPGFAVYYKEADSQPNRSVAYVSLMGADLETGSEAPSTTFRGDGNVLGAT